MLEMFLLFLAWALGATGIGLLVVLFAFKLDKVLAELDAIKAFEEDKK